MSGFLWSYDDRNKVMKTLRADVSTIDGMNFTGWHTPDSSYLPGEPDGTLPTVYCIVDIIPNVTWTVSSGLFRAPPRDADIWLTVVSSNSMEWIFRDVFTAAVTALVIAFDESRIDLECLPSSFQPPSLAELETNISEGWFARVGVQPYSNCNSNSTLTDGLESPITDESGDPITDGA